MKRPNYRGKPRRRFSFDFVEVVSLSFGVFAASSLFVISRSSVRFRPVAPMNLGCDPETWVTQCTGYMGDNLGRMGCRAVPAAAFQDQNIPSRNP
jgi:hypothetical protein